jgi:hypothetical protein
MSSGAMAIPMDITPSNLRSHDATCAFPSWPRRSSLGESDSNDSSSSRPTAFLSDDDLFFCTSNINADPFDESASSSSSSSARSSLELEREMDMQRERERLQREQFVRQAILEKENQRRRQQQAMRRAQMGHHQQVQQKRSSPSKKSSPKSKLTSIVEAKE